MQIFRKRKGREKKANQSRLTRWFETTLKVLWLLSYPTITTTAICAIWWLTFWNHQIHVPDGAKDIALAVWAVMGALYALMAAVVINTVWTEYKAMRMAIKTYNTPDFMNLCDEDLGPVVHVMMMTISAAVMICGMVIPYPSVGSGLLFVSLTAFVLSLIFFVAKEIDDPLHGIWFIKNVHEEWLVIEPKAWREEHCRENRETFLKKVHHSKANLKVVGV